MEGEPIKDYDIKEFKPEYEGQVIALISQVLKDQKVIPESAEPISDEDLYKIPEVYSGRGRFFLAVKDGKVVGTVAIREISGNTAKLNRMFVFTQHHGSGVGQSLLDHALDFARQQGFKEIVLNTHPLMKRAHHFYEKNGFQRVGEDLDRVHYRAAL